MKKYILPLLITVTSIVIAKVMDMDELKAHDYMTFFFLFTILAKLEEK